MYKFYCSNLQLSTQCGIVMPLIKWTQLSVSVTRYIVHFVCKHASSLGPMACYLLTSFVTWIPRVPSVSRPTQSAVQVKCTESSRLSVFQATPSLPTVHSSMDRVESPANHRRICKYETQQVKLKVKFPFRSFLQNPVNRPTARQEASRQFLLDIHNSVVQWARTRIGSDRDVQPLSFKLQGNTEKFSKLKTAEHCHLQAE